jgi:hypothetical protein
MGRNLVSNLNPPVAIALLQFSAHKDRVLVKRLDISRAGYWVFRLAHHQVALSSFSNLRNVALPLFVPKTAAVTTVLFQMGQLDVPFPIMRMAPVLPHAEEYSAISSLCPPRLPQHSKRSTKGGKELRY